MSISSLFNLSYFLSIARYFVPATHSIMFVFIQSIVLHFLRWHTESMCPLYSYSVGRPLIVLLFLNIIFVHNNMMWCWAIRAISLRIGAVPMAVGILLIVVRYHRAHILVILLFFRWPFLLSSMSAYRYRESTESMRPSYSLARR